jgi:hypothetical protein
MRLKASLENKMLFDEVVGKTFKFYGVHDTFFKIGRYIFEAIEDENDGYRSYLDSVETRSDENLVFLGRSFATVIVEAVEDGPYFNGFVLRDSTDGHIWLKFGTDNADDYYPCFIFEYQTKKEEAAPRKEQEKPQYNSTMQRQLAAIQQAMKDGELGDAEKMLSDLADKL